MKSAVRRRPSRQELWEESRGDVRCPVRADGCHPEPQCDAARWRSRDGGTRLRPWPGNSLLRRAVPDGMFLRSRGEEILQVERPRVHGQRAVSGERPLCLWTIPVKLDTIAVRIAEIKGLADSVVGGSFQRNARIDQPVSASPRAARWDTRWRDGTGLSYRAPTGVLPRFPRCLIRYDGDTLQRKGTRPGSRIAE